MVARNSQYQRKLHIVRENTALCNQHVFQPLSEKLSPKISIRGELSYTVIIPLLQPGNDGKEMMQHLFQIFVIPFEI